MPTRLPWPGRVLALWREWIASSLSRPFHRRFVDSLEFRDLDAMLIAILEQQHLKHVGLRAPLPSCSSFQQRFKARGHAKTDGDVFSLGHGGSSRLYRAPPYMYPMVSGSGK